MDFHYSDEIQPFKIPRDLANDDDDDMGSDITMLSTSTANSRMFRAGSPFSNSTSITSIRSNDDTTGYYREESGRMFHAMPNVPVVLPSDYAERKRINEEHELYKLVLNGNYYGPVKEILAKTNTCAGRAWRGLDVMSNSPWLDEMAEEFPHVKWYGCHFVPFRHAYRDNVVMEVYNINEGLRGADNSFDVIHTRLIGIVMDNTDKVFREVLRLLRPGGVLLYADLESQCYSAHGNAWDYIPYTMAMSEIVTEGMVAQQIKPMDIPKVSEKLLQMGGFKEVKHAVTSVPVGPWDTSSARSLEIGELCADNFSSIALSFQPLMQRAGADRKRIDELLEGFRAEMRDTSSGAFVRYHTIYAIKADDAGPSPSSC